MTCGASYRLTQRTPQATALHAIRRPTQIDLEADEILTVDFGSYQPRRRYLRCQPRVAVREIFAKVALVRSALR